MSTTQRYGMANINGAHGGTYKTTFVIWLMYFHSASSSTGRDICVAKEKELRRIGATQRPSQVNFFVWAINGSDKWEEHQLKWLIASDYLLA